MSVATYQLIEKEARVYALDDQGREIVGARQKYGHSHFTVYPSERLSVHVPHVVALTKEAARAWVELIADLYMRGDGRGR